MGSTIDLNRIANKLPEHEARPLKDTVADLLQQRYAGQFPGAQPVSFARRHLKELEEQDYMMCEKTDGVRCLLFLHHFIEPGYPPLEAQFLIDRKNEYYHVPKDAMHIPLEGDLGGSHHGTILDGELVIEHYKDQRGDMLVYFIFDCLCLDGLNLSNRPYDARLRKLTHSVYHPWQKFAEQYQNDALSQPFQLRVKSNLSAHRVEGMFKDVIPTLRHGNDGLIFTCRDTPYIAGTDDHILKWKPPHENTVDFRLQLGDFPKAWDADGEYEDWAAIPEIELLVNKGSTEEYYANLVLTEQEWEGFKSLNQGIDHRIIECWRDAATGNWRPKMEHHDGTPRFRDDKKEANYIKTVESVIESIEDAVSEADLIAHAAKIREKWREREAVREEQMRRQQHEAADRDRKRREEAAKANAKDDAPGYD